MFTGISQLYTLLEWGDIYSCKYTFQTIPPTCVVSPEHEMNGILFSGIEISKEKQWREITYAHTPKTQIKQCIILRVLQKGVCTTNFLFINIAESILICRFVISTILKKIVSYSINTRFFCECN